MKFLVLSLMIACCFSCSKKSEVPDNVFECRVNGQDWAPKGHISNLFTAALAINTPPVLKVEYFLNANQRHQVKIIASRYRRQNDSTFLSTFEIFLPDVKPASSFYFPNVSASSIAQAVFKFNTEANCNSSNIYTSQSTSGNLTITGFSETERMISGNFSFQSPDCGGVSISDGYFKLRF